MLKPIRKQALEAAVAKVAGKPDKARKKELERENFFGILGSRSRRARTVRRSGRGRVVEVIAEIDKNLMSLQTKGWEMFSFYSETIAEKYGEITKHC